MRRPNFRGLTKVLTARKVAAAPNEVVSARRGHAHEGGWRRAIGHRATVVGWLVLFMLALYVLQGLIWPHARPPQLGFQHLWEMGSLLWVSSIIPGTIGLIGAMVYRHPNRPNVVAPIENLVTFRIVSKGINVDALTGTIRRCQAEMAASPLFPYVIEVVTDTHSVEVCEPNGDVHYIVVPKDYATENDTLYKARALHYASLHSPLPDNAWIVHLDEETRPTSSGIRGIASMIREEEASGALRIGQGAILYHRTWREHPFLTMADNVRTGVDFSQFHFQHRLGITIFGFHGSYIVVRNDVEKSIGFDFGPEGSITEDAFWALVAMENDRRCRWVEGYLEEQSTQSVADFVRQRRRWFQGLVKVALYAPVKLRWRLSVGLNTLLWALVPISIFYTICHVLFGYSTEYWVQFLANYSFASFEVIYLLGLKANLTEHGIDKWWQRIIWYVEQAVLLPVFMFLEILGVIAAIARPVAGFHVVKK